MHGIAYVPHMYFKWGLRRVKPFFPKKMRTVGQLNAWFQWNRPVTTVKSIGPWRHGPILIQQTTVSPKTVPLQFQLGCELRMNTTNAAMYVS